MTALIESALQAELADHLEILEPGLQLVASGFPLETQPGVIEPIDILAHDRDGQFVVITFKHSRKSSRQATHEAATQSANLQRRKELPTERVRAIVVSAGWAELIVPFSYQQRHMAHQLTGYRLEVNDGKLTGAQPVTALPAIPEHDLSAVHHVIKFASAAARDDGWDRVREHLGTVGADNLLRLDFDIDEAIQPQDRFAIYVVIGAISAADPRSESLAGFSWVDDDAPAGRVLENRALTELIQWASDVALTPLRAFETGYPEKLAALLSLESGWHYRGMNRFGLFVDQQDLFPDEVVLENLTITRLGQTMFAASSSPMLTGSWAQLRTRVGESLMGNDPWSAGVLHWLQEIAEERPDATVAVRVQNPCDFIATLGAELTGRGRSAQPLVSCTEAVGRTGIARRLVGEIMWRGPVKIDAARLMRLVYDDPTIYAAQRIMGLTFSDDQTLLSVLGLDYCLRETMADGRASLVSVIDGRVHRRPSDLFTASGEPGWSGYQPLADFLDLHLSDLEPFVRSCLETAG